MKRAIALLMCGWACLPNNLLAQPQVSLPLPPATPFMTSDMRIVIMMKNDIGSREVKPIDMTILNQLSLSAGVNLTWEGTTRTNGQILKLPLGITENQARQFAETLGLQPGVLWASVKTRNTPQTNEARSQNRSESISRFVIKIRDDKLDEQLKRDVVTQLAKAAGMKLTVVGRTTLARILELETPMSIEQAQTLQIALESLSDVIYADPDSQIRLQSAGEITPNDPLFWRGWHLQGPYPLPEGGTNGYLGAANVQSAWNLAKGKSSIGVAVLDTGILFEHPDLKRALGRQTKKRGWDMVTDITRARDGNSRDPHAQDEGDWVDQGTFCNEDEWLSSSSWHGSHVAGIIAATVNNQVGVTGTNWHSKLVPVRVIGGCPNETMTDVADGIIWASGNKTVPGTRPNTTPVQVMNISLGMEMPCPSLYQEAIDLALSRGVNVVVSAGNDNADSSAYAPSNCQGVINVAATNHVGDKANYSNYGPETTIAAPGGQQLWPVYDENGVEIDHTSLREWGVWSTVNSSLTSPNLGEMVYTPYQGTSMAAPVVTGVISLMLSADKKRTLTPAKVAKILRDTARPFPKSVPVLTWLINPDTQVRDGFTWKFTQPSVCATKLYGQCGPGIIDAAAAVQAVRKLR